MIENLYVLYDREAKIALKPIIIERNDVVPVRMLTDLTNKPDTIVNKHTEDFSLIHIGEIDLETLEIKAYDVARTVVLAKDLKNE